ncbi:3-oxoacyl-(Acyl-carrier-protein) reductase [Sphingobium chlorophenolicum]|uniref:3-oxoacyl-(Acyl-carrier-protein) reductase n=2 Tax=Sphingobium chlorophenolicum TaxID=46429 RepID=A0A081RDB6_SPHCR|nr:SDR family oxidoreductase [Sphingobium chlorophenolicum]KEQ53189.1 3-oxoacyl-(Acyl-carrier-protein) reductase [Sphingobium chlorophenolicum]
MMSDMQLPDFAIDPATSNPQPLCQEIIMSDPSPLSIFGLEGKSAIVTGAGSGIGKATATLFTQVGARVLFVDVDEGAVREAAETCHSPYAVCDISDETQVTATFDKTQALFGGLHVLANVAAYRRKADTMTMPASEWDIMHAVTTRGTFLMMREAIKIMRDQGSGGSIVNVSSVSASHPTIFNNTHYDSAKAGVDAMTRAAAVEFAEHKIRVNSIQPGGTASGGAKRMGSEIQMRGPMTVPGRIPLNRISDPIEQARAILFLASDAASYITGHHLTVDGGYSVS